MGDIAVHAGTLAGATRGAFAVLVGVIGILLGIGSEVPVSALAIAEHGPASGPDLFVIGLVARGGSDRARDIERLTDELRRFVSRFDGPSASFAADAGDESPNGDGPDPTAELEDADGSTAGDAPVDFTIDRDDEIGRLSEAVDELVATVRDRERRRAESERYRKELYRITADADLESDEKIRRLLELGCERLGLATGLIARIDEDDDRYELETVVEREVAPEGTTLDLSQTFCQETIESDDILGIYDAAADGWADHPAAEDLGISCYVGGKILVEDELYGTICFLDLEPRERAFTPMEKSFVDLMTRWVSQTFERREHVRRIRERQRRLERAQQFTDDMLDAVDDVVYLIDEDGDLRRWNESLSNATGYSHETIESMHALDFFEGTDEERIESAIEDVLETGNVRVEADLVTKDGDRIPYEFIATALEDLEGNTVVTGIGRDISERKAKERRLRERERELERYKAFTDNVLDSLDDVFYVLDEEMVLRRANETFREVTGYTVDEIQDGDGIPFSEDEYERVRAGLERVLEEGSARMETELLTADGDAVPYEFVGTAFDDPDGNRVVAGVGRDISERNARERTLERTKRMLSQAQRLANVGAWELDATRDPPELEWSDEVYRIHGVPIGESVDLDRALDFYYPDDRERLESAVEAALSSGESYDLELRVRTADGDRRWIRTIGEPVVDGDEVVRIRGSVQDITERKERERELERTSEILHQTQRIAGVGGWELDLSGDPPYDGIWTDQTYEIYDHDPEGRPEYGSWTESERRPTLAEGHQYTHPADRERLQELFERAIESGEGFTSEHRIVTDDGTERWVRTTAEPTDDGEAIRGAILDITDRKERERELERTTDLLEQAQRIAGFAGWELDIRPDGNELMVTDGLYRLFDVPRGTEISPDDSLAFYHPEDRPRAMDAIRAAIRDGESYDLEVRMFSADGSERWMRIIGEPVYEDGEVVAIRGSVQDITDRKEHEQELERFETIVQALDEVVYTLDAEGRFRFVNDAVAEVLGYEPDELIGESAATVIPSDDVERAQAMIRELLGSEEPSRTVEIGLETADGDVIDMENHIALLPMADGEFAGTAGVVRDITERKERERELERTTELLEQAERIAGIGGWELDITGDLREIALTGGLRRLYELPPDAEVDPERAAGFSHPDDRPAVLETIERAIENDEGYEMEHRMLTARGNERWVHSIGEPVREDGAERRSAEDDASGDIVGIRGTIQDITEQKERELALESLQDAARDLLGTDTEREVAELVTETAADILEASGVAIYRLDSETNRLEAVAHTDEFASLCAGPPSVAVGDGDSVVWNAYVTGTGTVVDDPASFDRSQVFGPDVESGVVVPIGDHGVFAVASGTEPIDAEARRLIETLVATTEAAFDRLESEASLRQREAELEDRNRRLNRQIEITELIRRIDQSLIGADSREEIERTVPDRLLEAEGIAFAWIGTLDASGTRLEPRTWAGAAQEYLDDVPLAFEGSAEPAVRTARSETPSVVSNVVEGLQDETWRRHALDRGFQSVISVPLSYAEYSYGVLTVYADESDAFDDLERTVLTELGEGIANAITAVKTREALHAERLLELSLRIEGADDLLSRIATTTGALVEYDGLGTHSADETLLFFETSGVPADDVRAALDDLVSVTDYRLINEDDGDCRFEATVTGDVVASRLVRHGGSPRTMRADGDGLAVTVDVPTGTDVREFVEMLRNRYATVELQARRHVERSMRTRSELVTSLFDALTDRQLEVLRTAYFAGFFEWPRESTGEEIADMLEVTQPTVNRHLRIGQGRLLAQLFEGEVPVPAE